MRVIAIVLLSLLFAYPAIANPIDKLTFYTEEFPPYNYTDNGGKLKGLMVDVLAAMLDEANAKTEISDVKVVPWARGYEHALSDPNTVLFGTARTDKREDKFLWVGPAGPSNQAIIGPKSGNHDPNDISYFNDYTIATIRDDVAEQLTLTKGVPKDNLMRLSEIRPIIRLLEHGRADFWAYNPTVAFHVMKKVGVADEYEVVYQLREGSNWFAVNKNSDKDAVKALRKAMKSVRESETYERILKKYR